MLVLAVPTVPPAAARSRSENSEIEVAASAYPLEPTQVKRRARRGLRWAGVEKRRQIRRVIRKRKKRRRVPYEWHGRSNVTQAVAQAITEQDAEVGDVISFESQGVEFVGTLRRAEVLSHRRRRCARTEGVGWYGAAAGDIEEATVIVNQRWCWRRKRVRSWEREARISSDVTLFGRYLMLSWHGGDEALPIWRWNFYRRFNGIRHGRHASIWRFKLNVCPLFNPVVCFHQRRPYIGLSKRAGGSYVDFYSKGSS
jgi:hypothetical protein